MAYEELKSIMRNLKDESDKMFIDDYFYWQLMDLEGLEMTDAVGNMEIEEKMKEYIFQRSLNLRSKVPELNIRVYLTYDYFIICTNNNEEREELDKDIDKLSIGNTAEVSNPYCFVNYKVKYNNGVTEKSNLEFPDNLDIGNIIHEVIQINENMKEYMKYAQLRDIVIGKNKTYSFLTLDYKSGTKTRSFIVNVGDNSTLFGASYNSKSYKQAHKLRSEQLLGLSNKYQTEIEKIFS